MVYFKQFNNVYCRIRFCRVKKLISIVLCSYKGDRYIEAQRESIFAQKTSEEFRLYEYDDEIRQSGSATLNFLTAINEVPDADYYMLSDQDDVWHDDKIEKLCRFIKENDNGTPLLAFSDAVVTDDDLKVIDGSFVRYEGISPDRVKLNQLLIQNQVTGAACIFNNALRNILLSHRTPEHAAVHDHWLALTASAFGRIIYLDEALYDYRQHNNNLLGAKASGAVRETAERLSREGSENASRGYDALFKQAEEFLDIYEGELTPQQIDICRHFIQLPKMRKAEKIRTILKYGFTYNNSYRTIGELLFI